MIYSKYLHFLTRTFSQFETISKLVLRFKVSFFSFLFLKKEKEKKKIKIETKENNIMNLLLMRRCIVKNNNKEWRVILHSFHNNQMKTDFCDKSHNVG